MEYVDGVDLADIIEKTGPLPVDVGVMIALQVCSALEYAHMRGLIHRDIKPSNIMIKRNGEVKLMDFGIAHTKVLQTLTQPGTFLGAPAYMSPEQILGQNLDVQSDIFSFGIALYEMFTGVKPFEDEETMSVSAKILKDKPIPPRRLNRNIPRRLQRIIKKCLRKKPQRRFASMTDLAEAIGKTIAGRTNKSASLRSISEYLVKADIFEAPSAGETVLITKVPGYSASTRAIITAGIIIMLLTAATGFYFWQKGRRGITTEQVPPAPQPHHQPQPLPPAPPAPAPNPPAQTNTAPGQEETIKKDLEATEPRKNPINKKGTKKEVKRQGTSHR